MVINKFKVFREHDHDFSGLLNKKELFNIICGVFKIMGVIEYPS